MEKGQFLSLKLVCEVCWGRGQRMMVVFGVGSYVRVKIVLQILELFAKFIQLIENQILYQMFRPEIASKNHQLKQQIYSQPLNDLIHLNLQPNSKTNNKQQFQSPKIRGVVDLQNKPDNFKSIEQDQGQSLYFCKSLFLGVTIVQFFVLFSLILIQYISSKITIDLFLPLVILHSLLTLTILSVAYQISIPHSLPLKTSTSTNYNQIHTATFPFPQNLPTLPKINEQAHKRDFTLTKKIKMQPNNVQIAKNVATIKILKAVEDLPALNCKSQVKQSHSLTPHLFMTLTLFCKGIQVIFILIVATILLTINELPLLNGITASAALIIASYCLLIASVCLLLKVKLICGQSISNRVSDVIEDNSPQELVFENECRHQNNTKISIDHSINDRVVKSSVSIEKDLKSGRSIPMGPVEVIEEEKREDVFQKINLQCLQKLQIKKSVLKNSKRRLPKLEQSQKGVESLEESGKGFQERRKVEINSKKIQFFVYSEISPSNSIGEEDEQVKKSKLAQKSRFNNSSNQKMKYFSKKLYDIKLLGQKKEENRKNASRSIKIIQQKHTTESVKSERRAQQRDSNC